MTDRAALERAQEIIRELVVELMAYDGGDTKGLRRRAIEERMAILAHLDATTAVKPALHFAKAV